MFSPGAGNGQWVRARNKMGAESLVAERKMEAERHEAQRRREAEFFAAVWARVRSWFRRS